VFLKYSELLLHDCVPHSKLSQESHPPVSSSLSVSSSLPSPCKLVPLIRLRGESRSFVCVERIDDGSHEQMQMWLAHGQGSDQTGGRFVVKILKSREPDDHEFLAAQQDAQHFAEILPSLQSNAYTQFVDVKVR
jgi:hypothetical protein